LIATRGARRCAKGAEKPSQASNFFLDESLVITEGFTHDLALKQAIKHGFNHLQKYGFNHLQK